MTYVPAWIQHWNVLVFDDIVVLVTSIVLYCTIISGEGENLGWDRDGPTENMKNPKKVGEKVFFCVVFFLHILLEFSGCRECAVRTVSGSALL